MDELNRLTDAFNGIIDILDLREEEQYLLKVRIKDTLMYDFAAALLENIPDDIRAECAGMLADSPSEKEIQAFLKKHKIADDADFQERITESMKASVINILAMLTEDLSLEKSLAVENYLQETAESSD